MKITLTPSQIAALAQAPNDWRAVPPNVSTDALRRQDLVVLRDAPGQSGLLRGFQWKATVSGCRLREIHRRSVDEKSPA